MSSSCRLHTAFICSVPNTGRRLVILGVWVAIYGRQDRITQDLALPESPPSTITNPALLKEWIGIRRRGQNFSQTHIGRMVAGWNLQEEDFEW